MSGNAELWTRLDERSIRIALECYLKSCIIPFDDSMSTEELRQLYIKNETGGLSK